MDLLHLVDRLEELIAGAQKMPIGNRAIVDRRRILDLIDQMRVAVPQEVREAQEIVAHRDGIRREAEEEGRIIVAQAEERAARLVEQHEITQAARQRAEDIAREAERRLEERIDEANHDIHERIQESRRIARQQMDAADDYARELLLRLERQLQAFVNSVHSGIEQLEPSREGAATAQTEAEWLSSAQVEAPERPRQPQPPTQPPTQPTTQAAPERVEGTQPRDELRAENAHQPTPQPAPQAHGSREPAPRPQAPPETSPQQSPEPIPLHSRDADVRGVEPDAEELENLLRRDGPPAPPITSREELDPDPGVIDDFEHEPLDDDPILRPRSGGMLGRDEER